jgi:uncharacterized protein with ParB-like and HNH nuclease domain
MGNGLTYSVPRFQRDYSWTEDEWEDLWRDIQEVIEAGGKAAHYVGYLVFQTQDQKTFDVIDGQQRLTTFWMDGDSPGPLPTMNLFIRKVSYAKF